MTGTGTVLFDLFGVLARSQSTEGKNRLARTAGASGPAFWEAYWALRPPYDRGQVTGPGYWHQVADALGTRFDRRRIAELVEADTAPVRRWGGKGRRRGGRTPGRRVFEDPRSPFPVSKW